MTREEAIEIVRCIYQTDAEKEALATLVPELAESDDERIRKALIEVFKEKLERGFEWVEYGIPNRSVLSWLEKQKEIPMPNSTELIEMWHNAKAMLKEKDFRDDAWRLAQNWLCKRYLCQTGKQKEQKPTEWSEEDENMLWNIISIVGESKSIQADEMLDWLKSLRPQSHWKPSEDQMKWLKDVIETVPMTCRQQVQLESLYADLQKLL